MKVFKPATPLNPTEIPHFDGEAALAILGAGDPDFALTDSDMIYLVKFKEGATNHWHTHPSRQLLIFVNGRGIVEEQAGDRIEAGEGEVVRTEAEVVHRHGAAEGHDCTHIAIQEGMVNWLD